MSKRYLENFEPMLAVTAEGWRFIFAQSVSLKQAQVLRQTLADIEKTGRRYPSYPITILGVSGRAYSL